MWSKQLVLSRNVNAENRSLWLPVDNQRNDFHGNGPLPGKSYMINSRFLGEKGKFVKGHIKSFKEGRVSKVSPSMTKVHLRSKRLKYTREGAHF